MRPFRQWYCAFSVLVLLWGLAPPGAQGQARLNLDFEPDVNRSAPLLFWSWSKNPAAHVALDTSAAAHQGRGSVHFDLDAEEPAPSIAFLTYALPTDSVRGTLTVRAWLRTAGFHGTAGLYTYVYGAVPGDALAQVDSVRRRPTDGGWQLLELQLPVGATATRVLLGFRAQGTGQVWLDAVELRTGQRPYRDRPLPGTEPYLLPAASPNWDFERPLSAALPAPVFTPDSASPARGRRSLRLTLPAGSRGARLYVGTLPLAATSQGHTLTVSGQVRHLTPGPGPALTYALLSEPRNPTGTRTHTAIRDRPVFREEPLAVGPGPGWQPFRVNVPLPPQPDPALRVTLSLGVRLTGAGITGLDDVQFALDGQPYTAAPATDAVAPTALETAWLRRHLLPLPAVPPGADEAPLAALRPVLGPARVVGLGHATPGSADLARWQCRVFRLLVEQYGFTYLVLDADLAGAQPLDAYVQGGAGDPIALLRHLGADWNSPPMGALVQWLRTYNQLPGVVRLHVAGLRPQDPLATLAALRQDPAWQAPAARELLGQAEQALLALTHAVRLGASPEEVRPPATTAHHRVQELATYLDVHAKTAGRPASPAALAGPQHLLRLLDQYTTAYTLSGQQRASYQSGAQAENVYWLGQQHPAAKLAVWGPNHVVALTAADERPLGEWLRVLYGPAYVAVGTAFHRGTYAASPTGVATAQPAYPGTVEAWLHATGLPAAFLPLRALPLSNESAWLFQKQLFRDSRRSAPAQEFYLHQPRLEFDGLLFVDEIRD
jgi:erythromycin esterase